MSEQQNQLQVEIISPSGVVFEDNCHMVVIPAGNGEIGVMAHHESVLTSLQKGKISIYNNKDKVTKEFEVTGGFAEILEKKLLILMDG